MSDDVIIDADYIRRLAARREATDLDFKSEQYNWDREGNNELTKDVMAIANSLDADGSAGNILIGVEEDPSEKLGVVLGIDKSSHIDDAVLQQKISSLLNRMPKCSYSAVDYKDVSVGVIRIEPGGRPFYSLRDKGTKHRLVRRAPLVRNGSSTDIASPDEILLWHHKDNPKKAIIEDLQIAKLRGEIVPKPHIRDNGKGRSGQKAHIKYSVENHGMTPFTIIRGMYQGVASAQLLKEMTDSKVDPNMIEQFRIARIFGELPGLPISVEVGRSADRRTMNYNDSQFRRLVKATQFAAGRPVSANALDMLLQIDCESPAGQVNRVERRWLLPLPWKI